MKDKLQQAVEIFKDLGWKDVTADNVLTLPLGTKEQQKIALEGLKKGDWSVVKEVKKDTYAARPIVDVPLDKLALFAIRIGVTAPRAVSVAGFVEPEALSKVVAQRGEKYAADFIATACVSRRRGWEHSITVYGNVAVALVYQLSLPIPQSVEYLKDWVVCAGHALGLKVEISRNMSLLPDIDYLKPRLPEHLTAAVELNTPATGPLGELVPKAAAEKLLTKEQALELCFIGLHTALRPSDRKVWLENLDKLGISQDQLLEKMESLLPLLAFGESAIIERLAPLFIKEAPEHLLSEILMASFSAKSNKTKELVLKSAALRKTPQQAEEITPWIASMAIDKNQALAKAAKALMTKWNLGSQAIPQEPQEVQGLWQETPALWECPRFELEQCTPEDLTDMAAELFSRSRPFDDIHSERFLASAVQLAYQDVEQTKLSLKGIGDGGWGNLQGYIHLWAKDKDFSVSDGVHAKHVYHPLFQRNYIVSKNLGKIPCLLSTPSYQDFSITVADLVGRLKEYQAAKVYPLEADLLTALLRLDIFTANDALKEELAHIKIPARLQDNTKMKSGAGKLVLDYLADPLLEIPAEQKSELLKSLHRGGPSSLKEFPNRLASIHESEHISLFPSGGDATLTAIYSDYEVYHEQGLMMRQAARRKTPFPKGATMNFVASLRSLTPDAAQDTLLAVNEAWQRGLLRPNTHDITQMDWSSSAPDRLAAFAKSTELLIEDGMLSLVWAMLDQLIEISLQQVRVIAGTPEIVLLIEKYLPEVVMAVEKGRVDKNVLYLPGIRQLAKKGGSSIAVTAAKKIVQQLPADKEFVSKNKIEDNEKEKQEQVLKDFDRVWQGIKEPKPMIRDGAKISIQWLDKEAKKKCFVHNLALPDSKDNLCVIISGWIYSITEEGQLLGIRNRGLANEEMVYIYFDTAQRKLVVTPWRNWVDNTDGPLKRGHRTPITFTLMTIFIALLAQDGDDYYRVVSELIKQMEKGIIYDSLMKDITQTFLQNPDINCGRLLYPLEKGEPFLSIMWPIMTESIKFAGEKIAQGETPPAWINRVLDGAILYAPYLKEAAKRELIPKEDAKWQGLQDIAHGKKKSAAIGKAKKLLALLRLD